MLVYGGEKQKAHYFLSKTVDYVCFQTSFLQEGDGLQTEGM